MLRIRETAKSSARSWNQLFSVVFDFISESENKFHVHKYVPVMVALATILVFSVHPSVTLYQSFVINSIIAIIFVMSVFIGSTAPPRLTIAAIASLTFFEPEVLVTQTLAFNIIGDGLLIGAAIALIPNIRSLSNSAKVLIAIAGFLSALYFAAPLLSGFTGWRSSYEGIIIVRYPILIALAATYFRNIVHTRILLIGIAGGVSVLGVIGIIEALHNFTFNSWLYGTYLEWQRLDSTEVANLADYKYRIRGLMGDPINTGSMVVIGMGAWAAIFITTKRLVSKSIVAMVLVLLAMVVIGTASRTAYFSLFAGGSYLLIWLVIRRKWYPLLMIASTLIITVGVLAFALRFVPEYSPADRLAVTIRDRVASTFGVPNPNLLPEDMGVFDASIDKRLSEYSRTPISLLGTNSNPRAGRDSEYLTILLKFGIVGMIPYMLFWMTLAWISGRSALTGRGFAFAAFWISIVVPVVALGSTVLLDIAIMPVVSIVAGALVGTASSVTRSGRQQIDAPV